MRRLKEIVAKGAMAGTALFAAAALYSTVEWLADHPMPTQLVVDAYPAAEPYTIIVGDANISYWEDEDITRPSTHACIELPDTTFETWDVERPQYVEHGRFSSSDPEIVEVRTGERTLRLDVMVHTHSNGFTQELYERARQLHRTAQEAIYRQLEAAENGGTASYVGIEDRF